RSRRHCRRAADVSVAGLRVVAWPQSGGHQRKQAAPDVDRRVPQRAIRTLSWIMHRARFFADLCKQRLLRFSGDQRGVSAVEFALLLPLMVTLYLGVVEISQGISADRKVTMTARSIGDLVAQASSMSNSDMTNSLNAATAVMAPFPDS